MEIKDKWVYIAGPLFTTAERLFNQQLSQYIEHAGYAVYLPQIVCENVLSTDRIFELCIKGLDNAWCVVAILDGADADSGTCFEIGYAYAKGIPVIGVRTDFRRSGDDGFLNLMLSKSITKLCVVSSLETVSIEYIAKIVKDELHNILIELLKK